MGEKLYSVDEAAAILHMNSEVLRRWLRSGKIAGVKIGNKWLIPDKSILGITHGRQEPEEETEYDSCVCFPRWLEFSGLPGLITQKHGPASWNIMRSIIELDCQHNENPGKWVQVPFEELVLKSGLTQKILEKCLKLLKKDKYMNYKINLSENIYEIKLSTPIKTPINVFEVDFKYGGLKNSSTAYTNSSCVMRYIK